MSEMRETIEVRLREQFEESLDEQIVAQLGGERDQMVQKFVAEWEQRRLRGARREHAQP